jgi:hypothetical protein
MIKSLNSYIMNKKEVLGKVISHNNFKCSCFLIIFNIIKKGYHVIF